MIVAVPPLFVDVDFPFPVVEGFDDEVLDAEGFAGDPRPFAAEPAAVEAAVPFLGR